MVLKVCAGLCLAGVVCSGCATPAGGPEGRVAKAGMTPPVEGVAVDGVPVATTQKVDEGPRLGGTSATLIVHGLSCPSCAQGVLRELKRLEGVTDAEVDPVHGEALIEFAEGKGPTVEQIKQAVRWGGGVLVEVEQP